MKTTILGCGYLLSKKMVPMGVCGTLPSIRRKRFLRKGDCPLFERWAKEHVTHFPLTTGNLLTCIAIARTVHEFDSAVIDILSSNARDVPFAILYHVEPITADKGNIKPTGPTSALPPSREAENGEPMPKKVKLVRAGAIGIPEGHPSAPQVLTISLHSRQRDARSSGVAGFSHNLTGSPTMSIVSSLSNVGRSNSPVSDEYMREKVNSWPFREALQTKRLILVEDCRAMIEGYPIRVWDELPNAAVVVPVANDSDEGIPSAVLVIGLSIRRPFDDDYESFIHVYGHFPTVAAISDHIQNATPISVRNSGSEIIRSRATTYRRTRSTGSCQVTAILKCITRAEDTAHACCWTT